jgi:hypothetical protein
MRPWPYKRLVVARQGHRDEPDGYGSGFRYSCLSSQPLLHSAVASHALPPLSFLAMSPLLVQGHGGDGLARIERARRERTEKRTFFRHWEWRLGDGGADWGARRAGLGEVRLWFAREAREGNFGLCKRIEAWVARLPYR